MTTTRVTKGVLVTNKGFRPAQITIRCTVDNKGKSISFADDMAGIMLNVDWEDVEKTFKEEVRKGKR